MTWVPARTLAVCAATGLTGLAPSPGPQQQPFQGAADLVSIYATVTDRDGRLVPDLTEDDFEVRDNGRRQDLSFFSSTLEPFSVVVMLDRSGTMDAHDRRVRDAAEAFVRQMLPADRARVGSFGDQIRLMPTVFTSDPVTLVDIIRNDLDNDGASPVWTAIDRSISALDGEASRRVVLVLSDGHDDPAYNQPFVRLRDLERRVGTGDVMIYAIGFWATTSQYRPTWQLPRGIQLPVPGRRRPGATLRTRVEPPDPALRDMAEISGGGYFEMEDDDDDLTATFARVADELHRQYWLGFVPTDLDGKRHDLRVKVTRRGLTVRARQHYVAAPAAGR